MTFYASPNPIARNASRQRTHAWRFYFLPRFTLRLPGTCDKALPAAVFDALPDRPSRNTFEAALAALGRVTLAICFLSFLLNEPSTLSWLFPSVCFLGTAHRFLTFIIHSFTVVAIARSDNMYKILTFLSLYCYTYRCKHTKNNRQKGLICSKLSI